jgi:hypothetical protein
LRKSRCVPDHLRKRAKAPVHVPTEATRKQVWLMTGYGLPQPRIAAVIGVSAVTLQRHYREEMNKGLDQASLQVVQNLHRIACGKTPSAMAAAAFWLKTRCHWQEISKTEISGAGGGQLIIYSGALAEHDRTV